MNSRYLPQLLLAAAIALLWFSYRQTTVAAAQFPGSEVEIWTRGRLSQLARHLGMARSLTVTPYNAPRPSAWTWITWKTPKQLR